MSAVLSRKIRTQEDSDRFIRALAPIDAAFWASEQKWGVGRLERLQAPATLAAYKRGWDAYRVALDDCDSEAVEVIGPKMIAALVFMDTEASAAGHAPLAPDTWECPMPPDRTGTPTGVTLVLVRTQAEQASVIRAANGKAFTARPGFGMTVSGITPPEETLSTETTLPPDLAVTVRHQHEGRAIEVWTVGEVARLIAMHGSVARDAKKWEGTEAYSGVQQAEGALADNVRSGHPRPVPVALNF